MTLTVPQPRPRHTAPHDGGAPLVVLIADDVTGACDSAAHFARHGVPASLLLREAATPAAVTALCAYTRNASASQAFAALTQTFQAVPGPWLDRSRFFLKLDSAGRGPMAATILASTDALRPDAILCALALPALGRSVHQGTLHVTDVAGQHARIALRDLFPQAAQDRIAILPAASPAALRQAMLAALNDKRDLWICDSTTTEDLQALTRTALELSQRTLWCGSGGLAAAFAAALAPQAVRAPLPTIAVGTTLVLCGTNHPVTLLQLRALQSQGRPATAQSAIARPATVVQIDWQQTTPADIRAIMARHNPATLIVTGGDTAEFVLGALGADSILLRGELTPGMPHGRIGGGLADGCQLVTKSGGFGDAHALRNAISLCTGVPA